MSKTGQQSNDLEAPMWFVYLAIPLGSGLMCFVSLQVLWLSLTGTGELPHHDETHVEGVEADAAAPHPQPGARDESRRAKSLAAWHHPGAHPDLRDAPCRVVARPDWPRAFTVFAPPLR
ncbi:TRAP transporter small permease [Bradyrhizobium sp. McL0616]|uniref:TRAP transporter small permease n=1 Tax=Bradyrhizobium sp. McL0616 TaxID=3415674 RepID=UPI003CF617F9